MATYYEGEQVVTRRGKRGTVAQDNGDGTVNVRFGGKVFTMKASQVVRGTEHDRMMRGKPVPGQSR